MKPSPEIQRSTRNLVRSLLYILLFVALAQSLWVFLRGLSYPVLDLHGFRQTQTALSAYWMAHGGAWIAYETPVLGAPWAVPFEFPIFQWIVVGLQEASGLSLDICGRLVSYSFFLLTFIPLRAVVGYFYKEREAYIISSILLLTSPLYLFWSRTFMIETTALFASISFIACIVRWIETPSALRLFAATFFAVFAAMQKVTTFVPAACVAGAIVVDALWRRARAKQKEAERQGAVATVVSEALRLAPSALPVVVSMACLIVWLKFSDYLKTLNFLASGLTSDKLANWNYGTWSLRTSAAFWEVVRDRMLTDAVAAPVLLVAVVSAALALRPGFARTGGLIVLGFVSGLMIFSNLHFVHNYYQTAISFYLILAIAFAAYEIGMHRPFLGAGALVALVASGIVTFYVAKDNYFHAMLSGARLRDGQTMHVAKFIADNTSKDSVVIGLGYDWSSELPYYSQRKGLMIPGWIVGDRLQSLLDDPMRWTAGQPIGAIVICPNQLGGQQKLEVNGNAAFTKILEGMKKTAIDTCNVYRP